VDDRQERYTLRKRAGTWLRDAGNLRDGFLVTAAVFYFLGYIVWAINAYRNNLGLLPGLDFQYFIAGAPAVLIILALYLLIAACRLLRGKVRRWIGSSPTGGRLYLCRAMFLLALLAGFLIIVPPTGWFKAVFPHFTHGTWLAIGAALMIMVSYPFVTQLATIKDEPASKRKTLRLLLVEIFSSLVGLFLGLLAIVYAAMFFIALAAIALIYCVELYPKIPQEFGGARPSYAYLDVVKSQMSNETIAGVLPIDANKSQEAVVRSVRLEVLFSGSDIMLVRSQGKVYKLSKGIIQTVTVCD